MSGNLNIINIEKLKISFNPLTWFNRLRFKKDTVRILFIDDKQMPVVDNLKNSGWSVEKIEDVKSEDNEIIQRNHIIFVDYKGVGKNISKKYEGVGLAGSIKDKYGDKKRVILYSANTFSNDAVMSKYLDKIDDRMLKNVDTIDFVEMINKQMKQLR